MCEQSGTQIDRDDVGKRTPYRFDDQALALFVREYMEMHEWLCPGLVLDAKRGLPAWHRIHCLSFAAHILGIQVEFEAAVAKAMAEHRAQGGRVSSLS